MSTLGRPWRSWAATHAGAVRSNNQDALVDRPDIGLWTVADGAGGHESGEMASGLIASRLMALSPGASGSDLLAEVRNCVANVHRQLREAAQSAAADSGNPVMMASTIVLLLASGSHYACLWAGDSRAYRLRRGVLDRLTRDHSLVQVLIDEGALTEAQSESHPHANVVTRAIGAGDDDPVLDKVTGKLEQHDRFLLCSDGLTKTLDEAAIARLVAADRPADSLLEAALQNGARDNVTAVVVEFCPE